VKLSIQIPSGAPERVAEKWAQGLTARAQKVNEGRKARIPDGERYTQRLSGPSAKAFDGVINPAFVSRSGNDATDLTTNQRARVYEPESYQKYQRQLDFMFETVDGVPAKRYIDQVEKSKADYAAGIAKLLMLTGSRIEGRGITALAGLWLTGDPTTEGELRGADEIITGGPYLICPQTKKPGLKAMLAQRLLQAGLNIINSDFNAAVMAKQNQLINEQVQGFVDPALDLIPFVAAGDSHVDFIVDKGIHYLEIKISKM
jgi:hypothetical protein